MMLYNEEASLETVSRLLLEDRVGVIPADTVYGISARANEATAAKIYEAKRRPANKNLIMLSSIKWLENSGLEVPPVLYDLWPCALTAILRAPEGQTQAVRVPFDAYIQALVEKVGPIWSTSCNISGEPVLRHFDEISKTFGATLDFIVAKRREDESALPSTLVDFTSRPWKILRQGSYDASYLMARASM